jgi:hypothetical protein
MEHSMGDNDWDRYEKLILNKLEQHDSMLSEMRKQLIELDKKLELMDAKIRVFSTVAGMIGAVVMLGIKLLVNKFF